VTKEVTYGKNEEKKNEVLSNLRKFILNSMINGKIKFYCSENEIVPYEENKVYIPMCKKDMNEKSRKRVG